MKITSSMLLNIMLLTILSASFFLVSTTAETASTHEYDPWIDIWPIEGDGEINLYDAVELLTKYGTKGDPTRNVNVTNWPEWWPCPGEMNITNWPLDEEGNIKVSLSYSSGAMNTTMVDRIIVFQSSGLWESRAYLYCPNYGHFLFEFCHEKEVNITAVWLQLSQTRGPYDVSDCWYDVTINGQTHPRITTTSYAHSDMVCAVPLNITGLGHSIVQGINTLDVDSKGYDNSNPPQWYPTAVFQVTLFIEYKTN
jgi:hypothetical protein